MQAQEWELRQQELEELVQLRTEISERIHRLQQVIRQHQKAIQAPPDKTNTFAFQMFGKQCKDLTAEEHKIYYNARQRENRAKRKLRRQPNSGS